jgi:hypothetical protein
LDCACPSTSRAFPADYSPYDTVTAPAGQRLRITGSTQVGANRTTKAHLWVCIGDADYPYAVFDFTAGYTAAGPERFLAGYRVYLQADALAQYEGLYGPDRVKHCCCWAHARRKFVAAAEGGDERANGALEWIRQLYAIERELPPSLPPGDGPLVSQQRLQREEQRRVLRQQRAAPVLAGLKGWLGQQRPLALPKSVLGQVIGYALNNWEALGRYLEQGYLAIDNDLSERTLRAVALGRNYADSRVMRSRAVLSRPHVAAVLPGARSRRT